MRTPGGRPRFDLERVLEALGAVLASSLPELTPRAADIEAHVRAARERARMRRGL